MNLKSEQMVIQAPMSYTGSRKRIWRWTSTPNVWLRWLLAIPAATVTIVLVWAIVTVWYILFGLLMFPYRLVRRGSRKRKLEEQRHREALGR